MTIDGCIWFIGLMNQRKSHKKQATVPMNCSLTAAGSGSSIMSAHPDDVKDRDIPDIASLRKNRYPRIGSPPGLQQWPVRQIFAVAATCNP